VRIGPEIVALAAVAGALDDAVVVGDPGVMRRALRACGSSGGRAAGSPVDLAACPPGTLASARRPACRRNWPTWRRRRRRRAGAAAARCIEQPSPGRCRAPVARSSPRRSTRSLSAAGVGYPGHTEMLQALAAPEGRAPRRCA